MTQIYAVKSTATRHTKKHAARVSTISQNLTQFPVQINYWNRLKGKAFGQATAGKAAPFVALVLTETP